MATLLQRETDPSESGSQPARQRQPVPRTIVDLGDGRTIAWAEQGSGPDLVLVHGALLVLDDLWLSVVPALAKHFRCIAIDRPGHGFSLRQRFADASPWRQAAILREALHRIGVERPILLGHSIGGALALAYAMDWPDEVGGVVALAPVCFPEPRLEHVLFGPRAMPFGGELLAAALSATADPALLPLLWLANFLPQGMPERFASEFPFALAAGPERMIAGGEEAAALWPSLVRSALGYAACRVPVRILGGDSDFALNNALHGLQAARMMPQARFDWLPGTGHMLHHAHPDAVVAAARSLAGAEPTA